MIPKGILTPLIIVLYSFLNTAKAEDLSEHTRSVNLDSGGRFVLRWEVDWSTERVTFNLTAATTGYVAFGLSAKGELADIVVGGVYPDGTSYFSDRHGTTGKDTAAAIPVPDESQDWELNSASENGTHTFLAFSRALDTCDQHDHPINDDVVTLIWGYGETDQVDVSTFQHRTGGSAYLLDPDMTPAPIAEAIRGKRKPGSEGELGDLKVWTVSRRQRVPHKGTVYWCSFTKAPKLHKKHHLVGFNFRWSEKRVFEHTHHLLLLRCTPPRGQDAVSFFNPFLENNNAGEECYFLSNHTGQLPTKHCTELAYAYAIGAEHFFLPEQAGVPFAESPDEYYLLQVHYNNPAVLPDLEYEINIDLYYTSQLRDHDAGLITVGHHIPGTPSILVPQNTPSHHIYGHCGVECTRSMLPPEGITVVGVEMHTHVAGRSVRLRHIRGNVELPWIAKDDNYNHLYQRIKPSRREIRVLPGDHLIATCLYNTTEHRSSVVGGFTVAEEMCLMYLWYYNRLDDYSLCRSEIGSAEYAQRYLGVTSLEWSGSKLSYEAVAPAHLKGRTVAQISDEVEWTAELREKLQHDHKHMVQVNACAKGPFSSGGQGRVADETTFSVRYPDSVQAYHPPLKCRQKE